MSASWRNDPAAEHILALRKRMKLSRQKFADSFGLDVRAVQEWEQGRRVPDRAARVLLTVIEPSGRLCLRHPHLLPNLPKLGTDVLSNLPDLDRDSRFHTHVEFESRRKRQQPTDRRRFPD